MTFFVSLRRSDVYVFICFMNHMTLPVEITVFVGFSMFGPNLWPYCLSRLLKRKKLKQNQDQQPSIVSHFYPSFDVVFLQLMVSREIYSFLIPHFLVLLARLFLDVFIFGLITQWETSHAFFRPRRSLKTWLIAALALICFYLICLRMLLYFE